MSLLGAVTLTWTAPAGCPGAANVEREVASATAGGHDVVARAAIERVAEHVWRLTLDTETDGPTGHRRLEAPSCNELADAAALIIALEAGRASSGEASKEAKGAEPSVDLEADIPQVRPIAADTRWLAVGLSGGLSIGALAIPAFGTSASVAWLLGSHRVGVDAAYVPPVRVDGHEHRAAGMFQMFAVGVLGCSNLLEGKLEAAPCVGAEVGRVAARGTGPDVVESDDVAKLWVALRGGGLIAYPVGPVVLRANVDVALPLVRDRFLVAGVETVHRPAPVGIRGLGGVEMRFP